MNVNTCIHLFISTNTIAEVNLIKMSVEKKKRISKKNKSAWRKTDIKDVEEYLEEQRQEERIG